MNVRVFVLSRSRSKTKFTLSLIKECVQHFLSLSLYAIFILFKLSLSLSTLIKFHSQNAPLLIIINTLYPQTNMNGYRNVSVADIAQVSSKGQNCHYYCLHGSHTKCCRRMAPLQFSFNWNAGQKNLNWTIQNAISQMFKPLHSLCVRLNFINNVKWLFTCVLLFHITMRLTIDCSSI